MFEATVNVPGYLPADDARHLFDTPQLAWSFLADERTRDEDDNMCSECGDEPACPWSDVFDYSETVSEMQALAMSVVGSPDEPFGYLAATCPNVTGSLVGTVYGATPGYHGDHDLGLAYSVTEVDG